MSRGVNYSNPPSSGKPLGLYSQISQVEPGRLVFIAGQLAAGDFATQFNAVFMQIGDILNDLGTDFDAVVKFTTYLVDPDDLDEFMRLREKLFPNLFSDKSYPPNTLLIVSRLVKQEFRIEVEAVARLP